MTGRIIETAAKTLPDVGGGKFRAGLIGPLLPYRGGIAQHTTMLHRNLQFQSELCTVSFRKLYPRLLFPGKSDLDPVYEGHVEPGARYILDSLNPNTWREACAVLGEHAPHFVIVPWWTFFWAPCFGFMVRTLQKKGIPCIFLCHNVEDHETAFWKTALSQKVLSLGCSFLVHSQSEGAKLKRFIPESHVAVHPHPVYCQFPPAEKKLPRRARVELLFFGFVRPYKGLDVLIQAMHLLEKEDVFLTVAGEWWQDDPSLRAKIKDVAGRSKVEVVDRYVSEQAAADYFNRADVVVIPYRKATGSGVIPLAYHYGKPVIATRVGGIPDIVRDGVSGRLVPAEDPCALAEAIRAFMSESADGMADGVRKAAELLTWESLVQSLLDLAVRSIPWERARQQISVQGRNERRFTAQ